jgi:hypothetical protein
LLRWLPVAVVCAIAVAYVQPVRSYLDARASVAERRAEQQTLLRKQAALREELELAGTETFIEREARLIGLVRPGEKLFIVRGIEAWKAHQARSEGDRNDE